MFNRYFLFLASLLLLSACSYTKDKSIQDLTILTPGAKGAVCYAYIDGIKYKYWPPQTINVIKSEKNMMVDCLAPGNRRKQIYIEPVIANSFYGNVATGIVPGAAWDYASSSMFKYPDIIEVDFTNTPVRPEDLPAQNNPDIKQPEEYILEEFRPGAPRMNADRYAVPSELKRRERQGEINSDFNSGHGSDSAAAAESSSPAPDKGDLMDIIQTLGADAINPAMGPAQKAPAESSPDDSLYGPIPLYPGQ